MRRNGCIWLLEKIYLPTWSLRPINHKLSVWGKEVAPAATKNDNTAAPVVWWSKMSYDHWRFQSLRWRWEILAAISCSDKPKKWWRNRYIMDCNNCRFTTDQYKTNHQSKSNKHWLCQVINQCVSSRHDDLGMYGNHRVINQQLLLVISSRVIFTRSQSLCHRIEAPRITVRLLPSPTFWPLLAWSRGRPARFKRCRHRFAAPFRWFQTDLIGCAHLMGYN